MADLARNTMRLSILLSLIHVRGASLPDKRTELYDEYINLFLNREAEKSSIVRDKRELIVAIYQYLGYYLHARAESGRSNGRIAEAELRRVVRDYLENEGEPTELVDDLFTGLAERVFALVSRIQGTYEFEVQPLREYFAARYLYNTAPYSPTGREARGTKPDRFEGISQNPYWLNVTRFFAGCFSKGELCDLAERVCELIRAPAFELAAYPRVMAVSLLQDWVFSQSRRATDEVAAAVSDDHGLRWIGNSLLLPFWRSYSYDAVLHPSTGGQHLAQAAWKKLVSVTQVECIDDLARVIVFHTTPQERRTLLESVLRREVNVAITSLSLALRLEILDDIEPETVSRELAQIPESKRGSVLVDCVRARVNFASFDEADVAAATQAVLGARPHVHNYHGEPSPLTEMGVFWQLTNPSFWLQASYRSSYLEQQLESRKNREVSTTEAFARVFEFNRYALSLVGGDFHTGLGPWRMLIDRLESDFGESWSSIDLAAASAGIRSSRERGAGAASLFDPGANITDRFRFARRRGSQLEWWRQQLSEISDFCDARAYVLAVNVWASPDVQQVLLADVDRILRELDEIDQLNVVSATRFAGRTYSAIARRKWPKGDWISQLDELSSSTKALLLNKSDAIDQLEIIRSCAKDSELNYFMATLCLENLMVPLLDGVVTETESMALVGRFHEAGASSLTVIDKLLTGRKRKALDSLTPDEILRDPWRWPNVFVLWAQEARDGQLARSRPVKATAERERWFGA